MTDLIEEPVFEPATTGTELVVVRPAGAVLPKRRSHAERGQATSSPNHRLLDTLARAAPADLPPLSKIGTEVALEAMATATKLAIAADMDCWIAWCAEENWPILPADAEHLVTYLRKLEADGLKPATLSRRVASIATAHKLLGLDGEGLATRDKMVRDALIANRRRLGSAQRQAAPLRFGGALGPTPGFTITTLLAACSGDLQGVRDAALLSVGYDAGLRVSELTAALVTELHPEGDGTGLLHLPRSKTDQTGRGAWAWLSADTMRRVHAWLQASGIEDGPLFRRVGVDRRRARAREVLAERYDAMLAAEDAQLYGNDGAAALVTYTVGDTPLTRSGVCLIYRRVALAAARAGLVKFREGELERAVKALSTHSLRVGLTQDLFAAGADGTGIALTLRWASPVTALRYGRELAAKNGVASRVLARVRC